MKHSMSVLISVLNRMIEGSRGEQPIHTSVFKIGNRFDSDEEKIEARKNLKVLEERGWIKVEGDPFTTRGKYCGKIFGDIIDLGIYEDLTRSNDPIKQKMLDRVFSEMPQRGEKYSSDIQKELFRGQINNQFIYKFKINKRFLEYAGGGDWLLIMSALKEWESQGLLKILKDPQTADEEEICVEAFKFID